MSNNHQIDAALESQRRLKNHASQLPLQPVPVDGAFDAALGPNADPRILRLIPKDADGHSNPAKPAPTTVDRAENPVRL